MKKTVRMIALLTLALALVMSQIALAETDGAVQGVFDALLAEDSSYSEAKAVYAEYMPDAVFEETLNGDSFTITISGTDYIDGSWTYAKNGDFLTVTLDGEDINGQMMMIYVINAIGRYLGLNKTVASGYVNGVSALGLESDDFTSSEDESGAITMSVNIARPWEMKELADMAINENVIASDPLGEESTSVSSNIGKVMMLVNGDVNESTMLIGEYAGLDDTAYRSIVNIVNYLKPNGWEDFVDNFTELADAEAEGYSVQLNVDEATVADIITDADPEYSYALIRFGA